LRRVSLMELKSEMRIEHPLAHAIGEVVFGAGFVLCDRALKAVESSGIDTLYEVTSLDDIMRLRQRAELSPLAIDTLRPGTILTTDIFDGNMRLLAGAGLTVSDELIEMIEESGDETLYTRPKASARELKRLRLELEEALAEEVGEALASEAVSLDVEPKGIPANRTRRARRLGLRPQAERNATRRTYETLAGNALDFIAEVSEGLPVKANRLPTITEGTVELILRDFELAAALALSERRWDYLQQHTLSTMILTAGTAMTSGFGMRQLSEMVASALLHDLGMMRVPRQIVDKRGRLTAQETNAIHQHPIYTLGYAARAGESRPRVVAAIFQHHERGSGQGYTEGRTEENTHQYAKLLAAVDVLDAFFRQRPHREAMPPQDAATALAKLTRIHLLNPGAVRALVATVGNPPIGSFVRLRTGQFARVISISAKTPLQPRLAVLTDSNGKLLSKPVFLNTAQKPVLFSASPPPEMPLAPDAGF